MVDDQSDPQRALGSAVRSLREEQSLTQAALADRAELELELIAAIEAGEADPAWGEARRIARALDTTVDRLAELVEELEEGA
jgi:DNA-binding XRE family transcriptional regulator